MYLSVTEVHPIENYQLLLKFENNEEKIFDIRPFLEVGKFKELKNEDLFKTARLSFDTVQWANKLDIDPEILYQDSKTIKQ
ncbi:MAG: DUF2442 domain-containing protein [Gammaproteobacteria bacterium]|nr:MAG: DUF2442 domain-containing protein [Gammaproteobacteria bacterium]